MALTDAAKVAKTAPYLSMIEQLLLEGNTHAQAIQAAVDDINLIEPLTQPETNAFENFLQDAIDGVWWDGLGRAVQRGKDNNPRPT